MICLLSLFLLTEKGSTVTGFINLGDEFDFKCQLCGNLVTKEERRLLGEGNWKEMGDSKTLFWHALVTSWEPRELAR